jgi:hypothetical protein
MGEDAAAKNTIGASEDAKSAEEKSASTSAPAAKPAATTTTTNKLSADRVKQVYDLINGGQSSAIGSYSKREQDAG